MIPYNAQRVLVFLATVMYLPAVNTILAAFVSETNPDVLSVFGCAHVDHTGVPCCLRGDPFQPCMSSPEWTGLSALQVRIGMCVRHVLMPAASRVPWSACLWLLTLILGRVRVCCVLQYSAIALAVVVGAGVPVCLGALMLNGAGMVSCNAPQACQSCGHS